MPAILNALMWIAGSITKLWDRFFVVIAGFFPWLWTFFKRFLARKAKNGRFLNKILSNPTTKFAFILFLSTAGGLFIGILSALIKVYIRVRDIISDVSNNGSSGDSLGLFNQIMNSLGIYEVLQTTYSLWSLPFINLVAFICATFYFKSVMKVLDQVKLKQIV